MREKWERWRSSICILKNEHGVAEGEKAVFIFNGFGVGTAKEGRREGSKLLFGVRVGAKSTDEHEESALGEVKVSKESVDSLKPVRRIEEDRG